MNPITRRRWQTFRSNRRAFVSLCLFCLCFAASLCSEFVANDRPLVVSYENRLYFPMFHTLDERIFGGDLPIAADFADPFIQTAIAERGWALWPPVRYSFNTISRQESTTFPASPGHGNWLGTDDQGRDILARLLYGFRISVLFGLCLSFFGCAVGMAEVLRRAITAVCQTCCFSALWKCGAGFPYCTSSSSFPAS